MGAWAMCVWGGGGGVGLCGGGSVCTAASAWYVSASMYVYVCGVRARARACGICVHVRESNTKNKKLEPQTDVTG